MAYRTGSSNSTRAGASRLREPKGERDDYEIPEVYREMLAEAEARNPQEPEEERQTKRRKVGERANPLEFKGQESQAPESNEDVGQQVQTAYDSTASEESDMEWEEVDLQQAPPSHGDLGISAADDEPLQITLDQKEDNTKRIVSRRKPVTGAEKKLRLEIHKIHILCLLGHVHIRNLWCNDEPLQAYLKQILSRKVIALLIPPEDKPQYARSTTFVDGLNQAAEAFTKRFRVVRPGMQRAHWADDATSLGNRVEAILSNAEVIQSREDFRKLAMTLEGSRDFGAQLFCAMLRSVAVETRLVCSLQPLPFSGATASTKPRKPEPQSIIITSEENDSNESSMPDSESATPPRTRRLGQPQFRTPKEPKVTIRTGPRPSARESPYPVFWVEAYNEAVQKWIPIDPLVTKSLAKPSKFEPPGSDKYNNMSYVIAFEDDASARDVTRRYAKAFNAKTRKLRVESTRHGEIWWEKALSFYEKPFLEDRDEAEVSELTAKTAAEPMPRNVQDFKDHPVYALERHLRQNEVIHPKRVMGQVSLGKSGSKNQTLVPVYRRTDVQVCRSANGWYRLGRDIKVGEQPLKRVRGNRSKINADDDENQDVPAYAYFQTDIYKPPPVVQGKIPKNMYGNLDIYVPSMVPPGGVHIAHSGASRAAKILGIDYADAVTGFDFKGRHGTAVTQGIVIAQEYHEAINEVLEGIEQERLQVESDEKSAEAIGMWRHFLLKLRISERVKGYAVEGDEDYQGSPEMDEAEESGGGFFPEPDQFPENPENPYLTAGFNQPAKQADDSEPADAGTEMEENEAFGGGFIPEDVGTSFDQSAKQTDDSEPADAGTEVEEGETFGGGFIPEDSPQDSGEPKQHPPRDSAHFNTEQRAEDSHFHLVVNANSGTNSAGDMDYQPDAPMESPESAHPEPVASHAKYPDLTTANNHGIGNTEEPFTAASAAASNHSSPPPNDTHKESESNDEGSLLSEDPEDEDAIPEWLM